MLRACLFVFFLTFSMLAAAAEPRLVGNDLDKLLMLDTRVMAHAENARRVDAQAVKEPRNPLMPADQPWENATNNYYPNVLWDEEEETWKVWYKDVLADKEAIAQMDGPSTVHDVGWYLLYATSKDGLAWTKPALGLHKFGGSAANNIVARDCPNAGVFKDPHEADPARQYKMVYDVGLGQPRTRFSPDGIHWSEPQSVAGFSPQQGDTHNNAFYDFRQDLYLWYTKLYLGERLVSQLRSDGDFQHWVSRSSVLRSSAEEGRATQTYALTVFPYAGIYLGYCMMYHVGAGRLVDCELAWSPDSVHWQRVSPGVPFLPNGAAGSYDAGCIYAQAGPPVVQDGKLLIYYGGSPTPHLGWKRSAGLCLARLREDGFVGYESADGVHPAVLTTTLLKRNDHPLHLSADGEVKAEELAEAEGVRLRLTIAPGARLYAIENVRLVNTDLPPEERPPLPHAPARTDPVVVSFAKDAQGWKGVDKLEHHVEGYITVTRAKGQAPIARGTVLEGDWPALLGGDEVKISAEIRHPDRGGNPRLEIFARDLGQWSFDGFPFTPTDWATISTTIRYDWTDGQALSAGWNPSAAGFSWRDTIRHAGQIVLTDSTQPSFDVKEVRLEAK